VVRMSREALSTLKRFLQEKRLKLIQNIVQDRIHVEVYDGIPRGKAAIHAVAGHLMGEALRQDNKTKVYYGLLREPDLQNVQMDEDDEDGGGGGGGGSAGGGDSQGKSSEGAQKTDSQSGSQGAQGTQGEKSSSKKKKSKKDWLLSKKSKNDPNAPTYD
jgi:transcription initiation factor TFIID subunit 5